MIGYCIAWYWKWVVIMGSELGIRYGFGDGIGLAIGGGCTCTMGHNALIFMKNWQLSLK
jgi:hypothetical protein